MVAWSSCGLKQVVDEACSLLELGARQGLFRRPSGTSGKSSNFERVRLLRSQFHEDRWLPTVSAVNYLRTFRVPPFRLRRFRRGTRTCRKERGARLEDDEAVRGCELLACRQQVRFCSWLIIALPRRAGMLSLRNSQWCFGPMRLKTPTELPGVEAVHNNLTGSRSPRDAVQCESLPPINK